MLEPRCASARAEKERRRRHEERGDDPDATDVVMRDVTETLGRALEIASAAMREQGLDPDAPIERPTPCVLERNIHDAAMELALAALKVGRDHPYIDGLLCGVATCMSAKACRLCAFLDKGSDAALDEVVEANAFATLLLLEKLDEQLAALDALGPDAAEILAARAHFWRVLEPLRGQVPDESRVHLARLVEQGRAPSPFVVRRPADAS